MENSRSGLNNQRQNLTVRTRATLHAHASKNGYRQVRQRRKKVTLYARTCLTKDAEGACHQRSAEISGARHTVIAEPQPAFAFDRYNCRTPAKVDRDVHFPAIPLCFAIVARKPSLGETDWSAPMTALSKANEACSSTVCVNMADITRIETKNKDSDRDMWWAIHLRPAAQNALQAPLFRAAGIWRSTTAAATGNAIGSRGRALHGGERECRSAA